VFHRLVPRHRLILLIAVVLVSIFSSRIASDPTEIGSWLIVGAASAFMYLADVFREVEEAANALVIPGKALDVARRDVIAARLGPVRSTTFLVALALMAAGSAMLLLRERK